MTGHLQRSITKDASGKPEYGPWVPCPVCGPPGDEDVPVTKICDDMSGPNGVSGPCVRPPVHTPPHVDGIGGVWGEESVTAELAGLSGAVAALADLIPGSPGGSWEARWLVNRAGELLREAADMIRISSDG